MQPIEENKATKAQLINWLITEDKSTKHKATNLKRSVKAVLLQMVRNVKYGLILEKHHNIKKNVKKELKPKADEEKVIEKIVENGAIVLDNNHNPKIVKKSKLAAKAEPDFATEPIAKTEPDFKIEDELKFEDEPEFEIEDKLEFEKEDEADQTVFKQKDGAIVLDDNLNPTIIKKPATGLRSSGIEPVKIKSDPVEYKAKIKPQLAELSKNKTERMIEELDQLIHGQEIDLSDPDCEPKSEIKGDPAKHKPKIELPMDEDCITRTTINDDLDEDCVIKATDVTFAGHYFAKATTKNPAISRVKWRCKNMYIFTQVRARMKIEGFIDKHNGTPVYEKDSAHPIIIFEEDSGDRRKLRDILKFKIKGKDGYNATGLAKIEKQKQENKVKAIAYKAKKESETQSLKDNAKKIDKINADEPVSPAKESASLKAASDYYGWRV